MAVVAMMALGLSGCIKARVGAPCHTTEWGDDGGAWVLQCRNGRWVRALTKAQAAQIILSHAATTTTTTAPPAPPVNTAGTIESAAALPDGTIHVQGWVMQRGTDVAARGSNVPRFVVNGEPAGTAVSVDDDQPQSSVLYNVHRPDVAAAYSIDPRFGGDLLGFDDDLESTDVTNQVCLQVWLAGSYHDQWCATVSVDEPTSYGIPVDRIDSLVGGQGTIDLEGVALVSHLPDPFDVRVNVQAKVNGVLQPSSHSFTTTADVTRADVGQAFPDAGPDHGIDVSWSEDPGTYSVCIDFDGGRDTLWGLVGWNVASYNPWLCQDVTVS